MSLDRLLALAFRQGPATQANPLIDEVRGQVRLEQGRAINYEVALLGRSWDYLAEEVAPRLALYLRSKRLGAGRCGPVFLSLFVDQTLYFVRASDFFGLVRERSGLDEEGFGSLVRYWEETGRARVAGAFPLPRGS